jgi:hypothetical protein
LIFVSYFGIRYSKLIINRINIELIGAVYLADPGRVLKDQKRDDRRREKLKIKLEKKYQAGKITKDEYMAALHKIGYVTQQELLDDFKKMIREEIEYLEGLEGTENGEAGGAAPPLPTDAKSLYGSELNDENLGGPDPDQRPLGYGEDGSLPRPPPPPPPPPPPDDDDEEEYEEISEEMAEWDFDDVDEDYEDEEDDDYEDDDEYEDEEEEEDEGPGKPFTDFVKVDQRSGVVDYSDIKMFDGTEAKVMDSYDTATEVGAEKKQKKRKKRRKERPAKEEAPVKPEPELTETEKLIMEMEADTEEEPLDLGEVLIPDMVSTMKSEKETGKVNRVLAEIMWEADEEDRVWLQNKFLEEIEALKVRLSEKREAEAQAKAEALESADIEDWEIVKVSSKVVKVKKGKRVRKVRREIWKVVEKLDDAGGETREEKTRDESEDIDDSIKEEKRERKKEKVTDSQLTTKDSKLKKKEEKKKVEKKKGKKKAEKKVDKKDDKQDRKKEDKAKGKKPKGKKKKADVDWD